MDLKLILSSGKPGTFIGSFDAAVLLRIGFKCHIGTIQSAIRSTDGTLILSDGQPDNFQCELHHEASAQNKPVLRLDIQEMADSVIVAILVKWFKQFRVRSLFVDGPMDESRAEKVSLFLRAAFAD